MKLKFRHLTIALTVLSMLSSCGKDDPELPDSPDTPDTPEVIDPDKPVPDPAGTVTVNIVNDDETISLGEPISIAMDNGNNFRAYSYVGSCKIVNVGKVAGLGNITEIPTSGWKEKAAVVPGEGYVLLWSRYDSYTGITEQSFARVYVVGYMESTTGGIMGAQIKYQCPFQMPIKLSSKSVSFSADTDLTQTIELLNPTVVTVDNKPDWVTVNISGLEIIMTAQQNYTATERKGTVTLKNDEGSVDISISQAASDSPLFAGGSGTQEDPYLISTARQLDNIRLATDACFRQTSDIDLSPFIDPDGSGWEPITGFTGQYDGNMKTISGIWINRTTTSIIAMFTDSRNATFTRIKLKIGEKGIKGYSSVASISSSGSNVTISQCSVEGDIYGYGWEIAGIAVSSSYSGQVSECKYSGNIKLENNSPEYIGGIAYNMNVSDSYVIGDIEAQASTSGYYIYPFSNKTSTNCYIVGEHPWFAEFYGTHCYGWGNKTDEEMKLKSTYEGWNFQTVWTIREGVSYPELRCFQ